MSIPKNTPRETKPRLKPGDKVYRVVEYDYPDNRPHTWRVGTAIIKSISDRQIAISDNRLGLSGERFAYRALGSVFFETEAEAITSHARRMSTEIASANGRIIECSRGLAWAREHGFKDSP